MKSSREHHLVLSRVQGKTYLELATAIINDGMLCAGRIANLTHHVLQCSALPGDMVEFGCHTGRTAALMAHIVPKPLWLYDSFEGLPDRVTQDAGSLEHFKRGSLAVDETHVQRWFKKFKLREPRVYKSWFSRVHYSWLPDAICFAHLDGDMYTSIHDSIRLVYPRLVKGGVCLIDDYGWEGTGGVKLAADEYMADKPEKVKPLNTGNDGGFQGIIVKI